MQRPKSGINYAMLIRLLGWLLMIEAGFMLIPFTASIILNEHDSIYSFLFSIIITFLSGILMAFLSRPQKGNLGKREGILLTVSVWIVFSLFGMLPYLLTSTPLNISDAYMEAMSGFTTTGISTVDSEILSHGQMMWGSVMQWIGGMGIILFTLAVLPILNHSGGMQMFNAETTGITHDKLRPRVSQTAKGLWQIYIGLTIFMFVCLLAGPVDIYNALCITFSTVSTGGGYPYASDFFSSSNYLKVIITVFMFLGGVNFYLLFKVIHGNLRAIRESEVFIDYVKVIGIVFLLSVPAIGFYTEIKNISSLTIDPIFQIVSAISSTGFTLPGIMTWGPFVFMLLLMLMFVGACAGSTSGGAKIDRVIYLIKSCHNEIVRILRPNTILSVRLNGKIIPQELVGKVLVFLAIYVLVIIIGGLSLTMFGEDPVDAFFTIFMCVSNCGIDSNTIGYGVGFETLPAVAKWIMAFVMLTGRLELFTVLVLFTRGFWYR